MNGIHLSQGLVDLVPIDMKLKSNEIRRRVFILLLHTIQSYISIALRSSIGMVSSLARIPPAHDRNAALPKCFQTLQLSQEKKQAG